MNYALLCCILASVFYAAEITMSDKLLKGLSPIVMTMCIGFGIGLSALPITMNSLRTEEVRLPIGKEWLYICFIIACSFLADWSSFGALKQKAGAVILATFYILIPVICTLFKGQWPSWNMIGAWVLGGAALLLIRDELVNK